MSMLIMPSRFGSATTAPVSFADLVAAGTVYIAHRGNALRYPENTNIAYDNTAAYGADQIIEQDLWPTSDGVLVCSHDSTVDFMTTSSGNISAITAASWDALVVDDQTWLGVDYAGAAATRFSYVLDNFVDTALLLPEAKSAGAGNLIATALDASGIQKNRAVVQSFMLSELAAPKSAGYPVMYLKQASDTPDTAAALSAGVDYVCLGKLSSPVDVSTWLASGLPVFAFTVVRRSERDSLVAAGISGFFANDTEYLSADAPLATVDAWATGEWMPGMVAGVGDETRPAAIDRGRFKTGGYWGWGSFGGSAGTNNKSYCLQGWACPIKGNDAANDFTLDFTINFEAVGVSTEWGAVFIADDLAKDAPYCDSDGYRQNGYNIIWRQNGDVSIYRITAPSTATQVGTVSGAALTIGADAKCRVIVSATQIKAQVLNGDGSLNREAVASDSTYRGGYFHFGKFNAKVWFKSVSVT